MWIDECFHFPSIHHNKCLSSIISFWVYNDLSRVVCQVYQECQVSSICFITVDKKKHPILKHILFDFKKSS